MLWTNVWELRDIDTKAGVGVGLVDAPEGVRVALEGGIG